MDHATRTVEISDPPQEDIMQTRIIREDAKGPYVRIVGTVYRPEAQFVESAKKRVGVKVGVQKSASRLFGSILFLTVPDVKHAWAWRPEQYVGVTQQSAEKVGKKWSELKAELLNSDKPTAVVLLGWALDPK
jgi:hypothetical protein